MGVLEAFLSTWSQARATFGEGVPQPGTGFDQSAELKRLQSTAQTAAPGSHWSGGGANAYGARNDTHAATLGNLAALDARLGAEVDQSAAVVAQGRRDLDAVRQYVESAAASVPKTPEGEQMLWPVVGQGSGQIASILTRSNGELTAIAGRISALGLEYRQAGGPGDGTIALGAGEGGKPPVNPLDEILRKYQVSEDPDGALDWEPGWPWNMATDPKHVTATEARILNGMSPLELRDMDQIKDAAEVEAKVRFPPQNGANDTADNHTDAFRHTYWNALMTQRFGEGWTRDFATAHERLPNNPATAEAMDLYNNEVGRTIAMANPDATPAQLADLVEQAVNNGDTVVIAPGGERLAWSNTIALGEAGVTSPSPVPGLAPVPTGAPPAGTYDPGGPGGYGTSAGGY